MQEDLDREKIEDIKASEAYAIMLDKQEKARFKEIKEREERR